MKGWSVSMNLRLLLAVYGGSFCAFLFLSGLSLRPEGVAFVPFS